MTTSRSVTRILAGFAAFTLLILAGCGGSSSPSISVAVSPASATLIGGATQQFTATVSNDSSNSGVTWSATTGSISSSGLYTAPAVITATSATITATSVKDTTKTGTATVTLTPISVTVSPATINLGTSSMQTFTATVSNDSSNSGVTWSVSGGGSINSTTGVYSAPTTVISTPTTVTVTATSVKDTTKTGTATITLQPISIAAVTPASVTLNGGGTQTFGGAALTYDGSNSGVTWSVSPSSGAGTIVSTTGAYTAPAVVGAVTSATITAASVKDPTKTATATVTLTPISVSLGANTSATLDAGQQYGGVAATIANDPSNSGISFTVAAGGGDIGSSSTTSTTITTSPYNPVYYTPASVVSQTTTTITAASVKDPTRTAVFNVTLNPAMAWTTPSSSSATLTAATTNTAYNYSFAVSGGTGTKTYSVASGSLPAGLSLSAAGAITGTPSGSAGTSNFVVHVTDQSSNPSVLAGSFTIVVSAAPLLWTNPASAVTLPAMTVGTAMTPYTLATSGGTGSITYTLNSGTLPTGITLSGGVLSGTPTQPTIVAGNVVTFKATDSATVPVTANSSNVTLVVNPVTLAITSTSLPTGYVSAPYSYQLTSTGGTGAITWTLSGGSLTGTGLTLSSTGLLSGTPLITENALSLTFQAKDSATNQQQTVTKALPLTVSSAPTITNGTTLPYGVVGTAYSQTLVGSGGSGGPYTFTITSGSSSLTALGSTFALSTSGALTGTPTATGTATFTVQVKDSANNTGSVTFTLNTYAVLTLTTPSSSVPGPGTVGQAYSATIGGLGGLAPYTYQVNGTTVATNGTVNLTDGLTLTNNGSVLNITGTPTSATTLTFTAKVTDSNSNSVGPNTYSIVIGTNYSVSGTISLTNYCGGSSPTLPNISVVLTQGSNTIQTVTAVNGSYTFSNIPAGTYTITPSPTISGASAVFYPASSSVTLSTNSTNNNFNVALGYTVSGTISYSGSATGQTYIELQNTNCGGNNSPGTSISAPGTFTIRGVPPGSYSITSWIDVLGYGQQNHADPYGTSSITVTTAAYTGANVTLVDPTTLTLTSAPTLNGVSPGAVGAAVSFGTIVSSSNEEKAASYLLQWSTSSTFASGVSSQCFPATGANGNGVWLLHGLTTNSVLYFREAGTNAIYSSSAPTSCTTASIISPYSSTVGPITIAGNTSGFTVSGSVSYTGTATGPMYVGIYNTTTGQVYPEYFASPGNPQAYSVVVPSSSSAVYFPFAIIDMNNDGVIDWGDIDNTNNVTSASAIAVTGNTTANITLTTANSTSEVLTQNTLTTNGANSSNSYGLNFVVTQGLKLPVGLAITSSSNSDGANLVVPQDIGVCIDCGQAFQFNASLNSTAPAVNDQYGLTVTYSDKTTQALTPAVSAVLTAFATNMSPVTGTSTSTTPTFSWTYPANSTNYVYEFSICCGTNGTIWQIPENNSNSNGFTTTQIPASSSMIIWNTDPLNTGNLPSLTNLTTGTTYTWQIQAQDSSGNQATHQVNYQP